MFIWRIFYYKILVDDEFWKKSSLKVLNDDSVSSQIAENVMEMYPPNLRYKIIDKHKNLHVEMIDF